MKYFYSAVLIIFLGFGSDITLSQISNPRHPAEWEEVSAILMEADLLLAYPTLWDEAIDPFIKVAQVCIDEQVDLYVIDPDTGSNYATRYVDMDTVFSSRGLISPYIHIIHVNRGFDNFPWARDNGPYTIFENKVGSKYLGGFPGDSAAAFTADYLGEDYINLPSVSNDVFYYDGGNWLTDGHGTFNICNTTSSGFSNGLVEPPILPFGDYLGVHRTLNVTGVEVHTDYWLKLVNEETFITGYLPRSNYDDDPIGYRNSQAYIDSGVAAIKAGLKSAFGRDFRFYPIQNAPSFDDVNINTTYLTESASYTNSVIINNTVLVPQYSYMPYDTIALGMYRSIMPGYNVVGVNCRQYALGNGGLHCITREIYADNPIYIRHAWLPDSLNQTTDIRIEAVALAADGITSVDLFWTINPDGGYNQIGMNVVGNDLYEAFLPGQSYGTTISYYLTVENTAGKVTSRPPVAPEGYYSTVIDPDGITGFDRQQDKENIPGNFQLAQNYPNPFNAGTVISFSLREKSRVKLEIFNIRGELVRTLVQGERYSGKQEVRWDGRDNQGLPAATGVYIYRFESGDFSRSRKMILLR